MAYTNVVTGSAAAGNTGGIFLRNHLDSPGGPPVGPQLNLTPDIIHSDSLVPDPQRAFGSPASMQQSYVTDPVGGGENYYYVRGINAATVPDKGLMSLYWAPAQVFNFPGAWKNNPLMTAGHSETVNAQAAPGSLVVGDGAFVWEAGNTLPAGSTYYNFVAQYSDGAQVDPIPTVSSWMDLAELIGQNPTFAFRNQAMVDGSRPIWAHRQLLSIPASFQETAELSFMVSSSGMAGCKVALVCDRFTDDGSLLMLPPTPVSGNGVVAGTKATLGPGFSSSLLVQCWNPTGTPLKPGASLTVTVSYSLPSDDATLKALNRGLIDRHHNAVVGRTVQGIRPTAVVLVGMMTFTVAAPARPA
jgi:hypothetical protein